MPKGLKDIKHEPKTVNIMVRLLLVRHGESVWNEEERVQGQQDIPLSEIGRKQAVALGKRLKSMDISVCFSSPLKRAFETAELVLTASGKIVPIVTLPELMERNFGDWEGRRVDELKSLFAHDFSHWLSSNYIPPPPNGESLSDLLARLERGIKKILAQVPNGTVLVVGHSGSVKAAICYLFQLPIQSFAKLRIDNASLTIVEIRDGQSWLILLNDTCHLHRAISENAT